MSYVRLYIDHPRVGCGFRAFLVLRTGRIWAHLICTETAEAVKVPVGDLRWAKPMPLKPTRLARRLRAVAKDYSVETEALKEAIALLKAA